MKKIYFAGSIRGGRTDALLYKRMIEYIQKTDIVLTEHIGSPELNVLEKGNGGDARIILERCYPNWYTGGWPRQESFFNIRYMWVNGEFTPRETMRGKMALMGYLYGIRE